MTQSTEHAAFTNMYSQMSSFQKDAMEKMTASMEGLFGLKSPMQMFFNAKPDNPMAEGYSEYLETFRKTLKGMMDISETLFPGASNNTTNPLSTFMENLPGMPALLAKKILDIPPVGITRPYQEKINKVLDTWAVFNTASMEFMVSTMVPVEEATRMALKEISKQAESMKTPEDAQKLYEKWMGLMETEYQAMFKTDRYKDIIAKIFSAMGEFRSATRELVLDLIHLAGLPFGREVDELCKDVFDLKKKMKTMEAQLKKMEETVH